MVPDWDRFVADRRYRKVVEVLEGSPWFADAVYEKRCGSKSMGRPMNSAWASQSPNRRRWCLASRDETRVTPRAVDRPLQQRTKSAWMFQMKVKRERNLWCGANWMLPSLGDEHALGREWLYANNEAQHHLRLRPTISQFHHSTRARSERPALDVDDVLSQSISTQFTAIHKP